MMTMIMVVVMMITHRYEKQDSRVTETARRFQLLHHSRICCEPGSFT